MPTPPLTIATLASPQEEWLKKLLTLNCRSRLRLDHSLKRLTTFRIGGLARCLIDLEGEDDLALILKTLCQEQVPWFFVGKGSNLLFSDEVWPGVILHFGGGFKTWQEFPQTCTVRSGANVADVTFAQRTAALGWSGMEFLIGVPGNIGGAVAMNAGAHQGDIATYLRSVRYVDTQGQVFEESAKDFTFAYRESPLNAKKGRIVTCAEFTLTSQSAEYCLERMKKFMDYRSTTQPQNQPNCGSVFKNPPGHYAARLIEQCGLKGKQIGDAQVSPKHANFIVNLGQASSQDVLDLIELIREKVMTETKLMLELEVQIVKLN